MSKYTTELRFICEHYAGLENSEGYESIANIIANSRSKVFDFNYPIFDESYRSVLETKILKHFYTREICTETVGQWKHFLDMRMNEIMPYYNKLYESELIEFNPMYDTDLTRDHTKENNGTRNETGSFTETDSTDISKVGTSSDTTNSTSESATAGTETLTDNDKLNRWDTYQDTPQGGLTGVQLENYLTNARHITEDKTGSTKTNQTNSTTDTTGEITSTGRTTDTEDIDSTKTGSHLQDEKLKDLEDYLEHVKGKTGGVSYSKLLNEFRETFLNIDAMIISDLRDLFFNLW